MQKASYFAAALALVIALSCQVFAQNQRPIPVPSFPDVMPSPDVPSTPQQLHAQEQLVHTRHLALKRDSDQLLEMATELKQNVDKTGPSILSMDVIKQAEKIEKLAKSIREKMKGD